MGLGTRITVSFDYDQDKIILTVLAACSNPQCPEPYHSTVIDDFPKAAQYMQYWANQFLAIAPPEGTG